MGATDHCQRHSFCSRPTFTTQQYVKKMKSMISLTCELVYRSPELLCGWWRSSGGWAQSMTPPKLAQGTHGIV